MEPKKAEFARLFDLFERLTNRAARKSHATHMPPSDRKTSAEPVHRDIHDPSSVASIKEAQQPDTKPISLSTIWPRSTVAAVTGDATSEVSMDNFPIGKSYPFTFKMMVHRLYELEEWAKKVKDVLERSQKDFKPLSEMDWKKKKQAVMDESDLSLKQPGGRGRSTSISKESAVPRTRNGSAPRDDLSGERLQGRSVLAQATPLAPSKVSEGGKKVKEGARIVKKRCVGRDKIYTKNPSGPEENTWVYNAAAALMDRGGPGAGEGTKKGSLVSFQLSRMDTADDKRVTNTRPVTQVGAPSETGSPVSSRKRPYLFG